MFKPTPALALASLLAAAGCTSTASGEFHASGRALGTWNLKPVHCASGRSRGLLAADLFSVSDGKDTEVVAVALSPNPPVVLVRVPKQEHMVVLKGSTCATLEVDVQPVSRDAVAGSVLLDCALPDGSRISGHASFSCF